MRGERPYPLKLRPVYKQKIWGGRNLARLLGKDLPQGAIGESWEVADESVVASGPLAGRSLAELVSSLGTALVGSLSAAPLSSSFPLLIKFIDAQDRLSVQVHPDDRYAMEVEGFIRGKTEMWYVLDAAAGAEVIHGLTSEAPSVAQIAASAASGDVTKYLHRLAVVAGDVVFIPAGTVHAMGAGLVICEVQQNCDLTYRLYDWDRVQDGQPRELHVQKAVAVSRPGPQEHKIAPVSLKEPWGARRFLAVCRYFVIELVAPVARVDGIADGRSFLALLSLRGEGEILAQGMSVSLRAGEAAVLPAGLGAYALVPSRDWQLLTAYVPDLARDVVAPLLKAGFTREDILGLGGDPATNDLMPLL